MLLINDIRILTLYFTTMLWSYIIYFHDKFVDGISKFPSEIKYLSMARFDYITKTLIYIINP